VRVRPRQSVQIANSDRPAFAPGGDVSGCEPVSRSDDDSCPVSIQSTNTGADRNRDPTPDREPDRDSDAHRDRDPNPDADGNTDRDGDTDPDGNADRDGNTVRDGNVAGASNPARVSGSGRAGDAEVGASHPSSLEQRQFRTGMAVVAGRSGRIGGGRHNRGPTAEAKQEARLGETVRRDAG
jgi:hypothetical protein